MKQQFNQQQAQAWFQALRAVDPAEITGLWRGSGVASGHPLDGVLENLNWFGKRFHQNLRADALLFQWQPGKLVPVEPALFPIRMAIGLAAAGRTSIASSLLSGMQKIIRAKAPTACLKAMAEGAEETAAMVYDRQPITDYFRRIDTDRLAGMMCVKGDTRRYFFTLQKIGE